ncbi:MAG: hypothetical protein ACFFD2_25900, partial [Promethearchaeota archaeon]
MTKDGEGRTCPYCGATLHHPYWQHVQSQHPDEYAKNETWIQLYKDYTSMGMSQEMSLMVISASGLLPTTVVPSCRGKNFP